MDIRDSIKNEKDDTYSIVYADPPWSYTRTIGNGVLKRKHEADIYDTMSNVDIVGLGNDIDRISRKNSALLLWATMPTLPLALETMKAWGFKYKTCWATWVKTNAAGNKPFFGIGYYTRSNAELCLLGVKGRIASFKKLVDGEERDSNPNALSSICIDRPRQHSRKPDVVRDNIVKFFGDVPRVELFARTTAKGWCVLGDQSSKFESQMELAKAKDFVVRPKKRIRRKKMKYNKRYEGDIDE